MSDFYPQSLADWVGLVAGIAGVVLVALVYWQVRLMRKEQNARLVPWLGIHSLKVSENQHAIEILLKNFGNAPAYNVKVRSLVTTGSEPTDDQIQQVTLEPSVPIVPNQLFTHFAPITDEQEQYIIQPVSDDSERVYLRFQCYYTYGDRKPAFIDLLASLENNDHIIRWFKNKIV